MKKVAIIDVLEAAIGRVPNHKRSRAAVQFSASKEVLSQNIEAIYQQSTQRIIELEYYLEWALTLKDNSKLKPYNNRYSDAERIYALHHNIEELKESEVQQLNSRLSSWINNSALRELNEYLLYYLLHIYEFCSVVKHSEKDLTESNIKDIGEKSRDFEKQNLSKRLITLKKDFNINITHRNELLSLYKIRNILSHFDGIVPRTFCKDNGFLYVSWPVNQYELERRRDGKKIPYHKVRKPFRDEDYSQIRIVWLNKARKVKYKPEDKIELSANNLRELLFFYRFVFNELQETLIKFFTANNIKVRDFEEYKVQIALYSITED